MNESNLRKLIELVRLSRALPGTWGVFLRKEFDKCERWLFRLARVFRRIGLHRTRIVAVVGSLGKTTTRRALSAVLGCPARNFSYSNYGASLAANVLRVRPRDKHAVLEAGISRPGPMAGYAAMLRPDIVVVTSIKSDHNRSFPTLLDTRAEKVNMVRALSADGVAVLNGDDPHVRWMASQTHARVVTFGLDPNNDAYASGVHDSPTGTTFTAVLPGGSIEVHTRFTGAHMIYPFLAALAVADLEGVPLDVAVARLAEVAPADSRMELLRLPGDITILDDSFKGALESVHAALDVFAALPAGRRIVLFAGVEQPPGKQGDVNREIGHRLGGMADAVLCLGSKKSMSSIRAGAVAAGLPRDAVLIFNSGINPVIDWLQRELRPGDVLLIKGQSPQSLRRVVLRLQGVSVSCAVSYCGVKVPSCDVCPLLNAPPELFRNRYIARYVRCNLKDGGGARLVLGGEEGES
jgi:UDP-N-acetylmuramoyl-tripeptide--D-alanyl-D-alanine ligase